MDNKKPKAIIHKASNDLNKVEIARGVTKALRLKKNEAKLLEYYGSTGSGFRPAEELIRKKTGIADIYDARDRLAEKRILSICEDEILINWDNLAAVAFISECFPKAFKRYDKARQEWLPLKKEDLRLRDRDIKQYLPFLSNNMFLVALEIILGNAEKAEWQAWDKLHPEYKEWQWDFSSDNLTEAEVEANKELPF